MAGRHESKRLAKISTLHASGATMVLAALCLLILAATGWWLYDRWSALRDAQAQREEAAATMYLLEARSRAGSGATVTPESPSSFYPTLPGKG
jgi:hypothetical protein